MDNVSANSFWSNTDNSPAVIGTTIADGVLLLIVIVVTVGNLIVIAALIGKDTSDLVRSIRAILVNILAACVLGALGSALYHISSPIVRLSNSASTFGSPLCRASVFLLTTSNTGRVLFTAFYGVAVFIVVRWWNRPVLAPRNTKYFFLASAFLWLLAVATGIPPLPEESVSRFCGITSNTTEDVNTRVTLSISVPYFVVSVIAVTITPVFLIQTACYIKRKSIGDQRQSKKSLVNFGLFLMLVQGINAFAQIVIPLVALGISRLLDNSIAFIIAVALSDLSQIPTNALILLFFKPVRVRVQRWICCYCCHCEQATTHTSTLSGNNRAVVNS